MFSLDLVFMSVKLQVSDCFLPRDTFTCCTFTHILYINTSSNMLDTPQALHIHTHTKQSCANKCGPTDSYTQAGKLFYKWHVVDVYIHIYIQGETNLSHTHYSCQRLTFTAPLPVQMICCDLSIVPLEIGEVEEVWRCLLLPCLPARQRLICCKSLSSTQP